MSPGLLSRLSDRLHPILVRDVVQATRGRVHGLAMALACVSVIGIGLLAVDRDLEAFELSHWTLVTSIQCLAPLLLFAIPLMAFLSLREEVAESTADQLILTGMRPLSVVVGMLLAALAQSLLFVSMFAPLLAFSYLLLGVDVWTLLQAVWLLPLASLLVTALAFALMRLSAIRTLRQHVPLAVLLVLGWCTVSAMAGADRLVLWMQANARAPSFWQLGLQQLLLLGLGTAFLGLIGAGGLSHVKENRATSFRLLGVVAAPALTLYFGAGMHGAAWACLCLMPFWLTAVTDPFALSARHRPLVPKTRGRALVMLPFLPGSARGLYYTAVLAMVTLASGLATAWLFHGSLPKGDELLLGLVGCGYLLTYALLFCWLRNHGFAQDRMATTMARIRLPCFTVVLWCVAGLGDAMLELSTGVDAYPLSTINPLAVLVRPTTPHRLAVTALILLAAVIALAVLNFADANASRREVLYGEKPRPPRAEDATDRRLRRTKLLLLPTALEQPVDQREDDEEPDDTAGQHLGADAGNDGFA